MRHSSFPGRRSRPSLEELEPRLVPSGDLPGVTRPFNQVFVDRAYNDLLQRTPDDGGFAYWQNVMAQGGTRGQVALAFTAGAEYQSKLVGTLYHFYLGRAVDGEGRNFWLNALKTGATDEQIKAGILGSDEYFQKAGGTRSGFLAALFPDVLGRPLDAVGRTFFVQELSQGVSRATVAGQVVGSSEGVQNLVAGYYHQFLQRAGDAGGMSFWAAAVQAGATDEQVAAQFSASDEYAALLAQSRGDATTDWHNILYDAIRTDKTPPPQAARALAMVGAAVYDAVEPVEGLHQLYNPANAMAGLPTSALPGTSREAAAVEAAYTVLVGLFPAQTATFDQDLAASLASIPDGVGKTDGAALGVTVAKAVLAWRRDDGSATKVTYTPGTAPGQWQPTPPALAAALDAQWPAVTPFTMTAGSQFRPAGPPALASAAYAADFNATKSLGSVNSTARTALQTTIAEFWSDGGGTQTPPGHWDQIAQDVSRQQGHTLGENARTFALVDLALADAAIVSWDAKFTYNSWRPITAIRNADPTVNAQTTPDPNWTPLLTTPPFPEYTSGHSTFSGAADAVLTSLFGPSRSFATSADGLPRTQRTFTSFTQAADEAGESRIYGGIHFESANQDGLASGRALGSYVVQNFLQ